ncbi:MAG: sodium-dependent transporter [Prevotella sp.]|nr:sodium-dependent transporter [Prevotella sp.]
MEHRGAFASRLGIILATAGSAVGLGNIWRFPYEVGQNGGAAFILVYLCCIVALGVPAMLCEFILGRRAQANASRAYGSWPWKGVGYMGVFTGFIIMGFYSVVAGWTVQYVVASLVGHLNGDADFFKQYFADFTSHPVKPVLWTVFFLIVTHLVVIRGVQRGIERASKVMMPVLFVLLLLLIVCSLMLPGSWAGVEFLFKPDFSKINSTTFFDALGQTFFSLSAGMACLVTYASYFDKQVSLTRSAFQIAAIDTLVAILSGLMIFPAAFSVGVNPDSGPSLIFITLPNVFQQAFSGMPLLGYVISIVFYLLLLLAALTSIISMHETPTAFVSEEFRLSRKGAARLVTLCAIVVGTLCSLSLNAVPRLRLFGMQLFDFFDYLSANILLTAGGFLTSIYVGWILPKKAVFNEIANSGTLGGRFFPVFLFAARFICPLGILIIFLHQLHVI